MTRHLIWILLLVLLLLQGTVIPWILPVSWQGATRVDPHLMLTVVLYLGLHVGRHTALAYGIGFGLLHDFLFYGNMIGVYSFGMGLAGYLAGLMQRFARPSLLFNLVVVGFGQFLFDVINLALNRLFKTTSMPFDYALMHQMLPSLLLNLAFALLIYVPVRKYLERIAAAGKPEAEE
jgi:rod shape-determining protein MreD